MELVRDIVDTVGKPDKVLKFVVGEYLHRCSLANLVSKVDLGCVVVAM
jgi:hypothetical protein